MKQVWSVAELVEQWSFSVEDQELLVGKHASGRLGFVAQLAFYRVHARFPSRLADFAPAVITHLAEQLDSPEAALDELPVGWGHAIERARIYGKRTKPEHHAARSSAGARNGR